MRRLVPAFLLVVVLALPAAASAADQGVTISAGGFDKHSVDLTLGEKVTFTNNSLPPPLNESVRFEDEGSSRCEITLNPDCERTFTTAGRFPFYDPHQAGCTSYATCSDAYRGIVIVDGPPRVTGLNGPSAENRGQPVAFTASGSDPNGDAISGFNWDFGDSTG
ncbi:MAG: hypothetical protein ACJ77Z_05810, partial [Thermoleophilaceae bacterium]